MNPLIIWLTDEVYYRQNWYGWLKDNRVSASYVYSWKSIEFECAEDLLMFKLRFGI